MNVEFYRHQLSHDIIPELEKVFGSVFLTTGPVTERFETAFADYLGVRRSVGLASCTAGLFLCFKAWDIGPGDEVIVPSMTFVATANAVLHAGAVPVFADVDASTGLLDLEDAARKVTPRTKAIVPVHLYGRMADMRAFRTFADRHGLKLLEDAAHCVEGEIDGVKPGQLGDAACFSFYATKNITCGEGGAVATNDNALADRIRILRLHGLDKDAAMRYHSFRHWDMVELGWKYNMNDIQAAMLMPQLKRIEASHIERKRVHGEYIRLIGGIPGVEVVTTDTPSVKHAYHLFVVRVQSGVRERLIGHLIDSGVGITVNYLAVHLNSFYKETLGTRTGMCPRAEAMGEEVLSLPFYPGLGNDAIAYVASTLAHFMEKENS